MTPPTGGIAEDKKVSQPTKLLYNHKAHKVPIIPLMTDKVRLLNPVIFAKPKPEA